MSTIPPPLTSNGAPLSYLPAFVADSCELGEVNVSKTNVTQVTSITTGVTVNANSGWILTVSATTAQHASSVFTVTNDRVVAGSTVLVNVNTNNGAGTALVTVDNIAAGSFDVVLTNVAAAALDNTIRIGFLVV